MEVEKETGLFSNVSEVDDTFRSDLTQEEAQNLYTQWAEEGTYDKIMGENQKYRAPCQIPDVMKGLFPQPEKVLILDVGAGTGLSGKYLRDLGYTNVHALEPNHNFVTSLANKGLYTKIIEEFIGGDKPLDIADDTYDAILTCGTFAAGHLPCSSLPEMVRLVKPGGYVVIIMREECLWQVAEYKDKLEPLMDQLVAQGKWKRLRREIYPNHYPNKSGVRMVFQVC